MYAFHAWLVLLESTVEDDFASVQTRLPWIRQLIARSFQRQTGQDDPVTITNGLVVLQMSLCRNHRGDSHSMLLDVLGKIGKELPGTYGLIYWNDDEDRANSDCFQVIVVARGQLQHRPDPFLSPLNPVVED